MAVSVLGRRGGPVARVYRLWLAWLGIWLLTTAAVYAIGAAPASRWLAAGLAVSLGGFALGAGILARPLSEQEVLDAAAACRDKSSRLVLACLKTTD